MCASPLSFLRAGPPPPKVVLLPDALFFTRAMPVTAGATPAEAAAQVELALEAVSPFPLAQLYYGFYWQPGAVRAFVFAAYRRRFTSEQTAAWSEAEVVLPKSAALFGASLEPATTVVLTEPELITAIFWEEGNMPGKVLSRTLEPEATDEDRAAARDELLHAIGGSKAVIDLALPPVADPSKNDRELVFRSGDVVSRLPANVANPLDVRDKTDLSELRAARRRDVVLWRVAVGCAAALLLLGLLELTLVGGKMWQNIRLAQLNGRRSAVDKIVASAELANQISDLTTKRLLPLEMVTALVGADTDRKRKPDEIIFTRVQTRPEGGLYKLFVQARTTNAAQIPAYESQLKALPEFQDVRVNILQGLGDRFDLEVTFKPEFLKPSP